MRVLLDLSVLSFECVGSFWLVFVCVARFACLVCVFALFVVLVVSGEFGLFGLFVCDTRVDCFVCILVCV